MGVAIHVDSISPPPLPQLGHICLKTTFSISLSFPSSLSSLSFLSPLLPHLSLHPFPLQYSGLVKQLPFQVVIPTLQFLSANTLLLRLEHVYQIDDPPPFSDTATVILDVSRQIEHWSGEEATTKGEIFWGGDKFMEHGSGEETRLLDVNIGLGRRYRDICVHVPC